LFAGSIMYFSWDDGIALNYILIFVIMAFTGGVGGGWFLAALGTLLVLSPIVFSKLDTYQQERILVLFDPTIDPMATGIRWQMNRSLRMLKNGGMAGQGLFNGSMVQSGSLSAQHTDFIFSSAGEELGMIGCLLILLILCAIILRCVQVGIKSENYMNRLICLGIAGLLTSQIAVNVGMCLGVFPVVGLTLPFISYGGSSIVTMFAAMGIVSGIYMRPAPDSSARYIRPKM
ncbi:MAG: FtsW/RodA/SpoVE family cell cycle protein, partial [Oscillospiraceae bacterium]|nr:FtsW/RodA/SpoVE family cell cycle protein [Oscillospiraceae bacterium]